MGFVLSGALEYKNRNQNEPADRITSPCWLCEASLWSELLHTGTCTGVTECTLAEIGAYKFGDLVLAHKFALEKIRKYARSWHEHADLSTDLAQNGLNFIQELARGCFDAAAPENNPVNISKIKL